MLESGVLVDCAQKENIPFWESLYLDLFLETDLYIPWLKISLLVNVMVVAIIIEVNIQSN